MNEETIEAPEIFAASPAGVLTSWLLDVKWPNQRGVEICSEWVNGKDAGRWVCRLRADAKSLRSVADSIEEAVSNALDMVFLNPLLTPRHCRTSKALTALEQWAKGHRQRFFNGLTVRSNGEFGLLFGHEDAGKLVRLNASGPSVEELIWSGLARVAAGEGRTWE